MSVIQSISTEQLPNGRWRGILERPGERRRVVDGATEEEVEDKLAEITGEI